MVAPESWNIFKKVKRNKEIRANIKQNMIKKTLFTKKKLRVSKICGKNDIISIGAGNSGDTVEITDQQILPLNMYCKFY